jgi:hypothetical protein
MVPVLLLVVVVVVLLLIVPIKVVESGRSKHVLDFSIPLSLTSLFD